MADEGLADLVDRLRRQDPVALREIYQLLKDDVLAVAATVLGTQASGEAAWDVLHDVFVSLARTSRSLSPDSNLRAYLTRAAVNRARDRLRSKGRVSGSAIELEQVPTPEAGIADLMERDDEAAMLWRCVAELPEEQRVVVSLHIWGGQSLAEIARMEGISPNTAQSRWRYALQKLREKYPSGVER